MQVWVASLNSVFFSSAYLGANKTGPDQYVELNALNLRSLEVTSDIQITPPIPIATGATNLEGDTVLISSFGMGGGAVFKVNLTSRRSTRVVDNWFGLRFNGVDDIVRAKDGSLWFTDNQYGYEVRGGLRGKWGPRGVGACARGGMHYPPH